MTTIGIYTDRTLTDSEVTSIREFFGSSDKPVIFSSVPHSLSDPLIASLSVFYMYFFNGIVIFNNANEMKELAPKIRTDRIFLMNNNEISSVDKKDIKQ